MVLWQQLYFIRCSSKFCHLPGVVFLPYFSLIWHRFLHDFVVCLCSNLHMPPLEFTVRLMLECFFLLLLCRWTISWVITPWTWAMLWGMATSSLDMYITEVHQHPMTINITPAKGGGSGSTPTMPIPTTSQEPWLEGLISLTSSVICVTFIIKPSQLWPEMLDWLQHLYPWQPLLAMALTKIPYLQRFIHSIHRPHHPHHLGSHNRQMQKSQCSHCYFIC